MESEAGIFPTCWTEDIAAEAIARVRDAYPHLPGGAIARLREKIEGSMTEKIEDYEPRPDMPIADIGDHHVHAAAVPGGHPDDPRQRVPQTRKRSSDRLPHEACFPDDVFTMIDERRPDLVATVAQVQLAYLRKQDRDGDLGARLMAASSPRFAEQAAGDLLLRERQAGGFAAAKARGVYKGRRTALTPEQAVALVARTGAGERTGALAAEYGISRETVSTYLRAVRSCLGDELASSATPSG